MLALPTAAAQAQGGAARPMREGTLSYKDARLGGKVPVRNWQLYIARENQKEKDYGPNTDPKFNVTYPGKLQVMCSTDEETRGPERAFVIHYIKPEEEPFARQVGAMMARLYWLGIDYLDAAPAPGRYINVWLARHGEPGAEEFQRNIYLFAVGQNRSAAEWIRELAHEYSHIILPPVGEFSAPEKWANGYLGERLFMKWLLLDNGVADAWSEPVDGAAYVAKEVTPLRQRYQNAGPGSPLGEKMDAEGMDHWIGQVLSIEASHGPTVVRELFKKYATRRPQSLTSYLNDALFQIRPLQFPVDPTTYIPAQSEVEKSAPGAGVRVKKATYWLYLPGGDWTFTVAGTLPDGIQASLEGADLKKGAAFGANAVWETSMPGANGSWRRFEISAPEGKTADLQTIQVVRKGDK